LAGATACAGAPARATGGAAGSAGAPAGFWACAAPSVISAAIEIDNFRNIMMLLDSEAATS
jgi:hypothetical protein